MPKRIFSGSWEYRALRPSVLTSKLGIEILPSSPDSDNLQYSTGSAVLSGVGKENMITDQITLEFWVRANWDAQDGILHQIIDIYGNATNRVQLYKNTSNNLIFEVLGAGTSRTASVAVTWKAGSWNYIVAVASKNRTINGSNYLYLYVNETGAGSASAPVALAVLPGVFQLGQDNAGLYNLNGVITGRILKRCLEAAEVTANYASGAGLLESFNTTPDTIWNGNFSDQTTNCASWHRGKSVSAIADGATEDTLTTAAGADVSFADNDRVVVSDGTGYSSHDIDPVQVDGTPSSTSLAVDDGAGADPGVIEKIGRNLDFNAAYRADAANNTIHDITTQDLGISFWVKIDTDAPTLRAFCSKRTYPSPNTGWVFRTSHTAGALRADLCDSGNEINIYSTSTSLNDNKWHHIAVIWDRNNQANCKVFIDGVNDTAYILGNIANITNLTNTGLFRLGADSHGGSGIDGQMRDVVLSYPADIMAAGEMGAAGEIEYLATHPFDKANYCNYEDYWACDDGSGLTITGDVNNLTLSNALAWSQEAFVSKNVIPDIGFENGGIGGITADATWTLTKDKTTVKYGTQSLKAVNAAGNDGDAITIASPYFTNGADRYYRFWLYVNAIHASSNLNLVITGSGTILTRQLDTGTDDMGTAYALNTWLMFEGCYEADQTGAHTIQLQITGAGAGTNSATIYVDEWQDVPNMLTNGGMEGGANPPTGWTQEASATVISDTSPHTGTNCMKVTAGGVVLNGAYQNVTLVSGNYYTLSAWAKATAGDYAYIRVNPGDANIITAGSISSTSWTKLVYAFKATGTAGVIYVRGLVNGDIVWFDDVSLVRVDGPTAASTATKGTGIVPVGNPIIGDEL